MDLKLTPTEFEKSRLDAAVKQLHYLCNTPGIKGDFTTLTHKVAKETGINYLVLLDAWAKYEDSLSCL